MASIPRSAGVSYDRVELAAKYKIQEMAQTMEDDQR
jgi:hypothetical protein